MAIKRIRNIGQIGVVSDIPVHSSPVNAWTDARNVSFLGYCIEKRGGFVPEYDTKNADASLRMTGANIHEIIPSMNEARGALENVTVYAGDAHVWRRSLDGSMSIMDRASNGTGYSANIDNPWRATNFSNAVVLTNPIDVPQAMAVTDLRLSNLPAWGINTIGASGDENFEYWRTPRIVAHKNFLIALSTTEGADEASARYHPQRIRWSDISDIGQLPQSWDEASLTNSAGYMDLTDATGAFVEAVPMRGGLMLYSSDETFKMTFVGGNTIFRFDKVFDDLGVLNPHCVGKFGTKHVVVTDTDVRVHDGSTHSSIVESTIKDRLFRELKGANTTSEVKVKVRESIKEIWICYRAKGSTPAGYQDTAAVFNYEAGTWVFVDLPEIYTIEEVPDIATTTKVTWGDNIDPLTDTWGSEAMIGKRWSSLTRTEGDLYMTGYGKDDCILRLATDTSHQVSGRDSLDNLTTSPLPILLRRDGLDFDLEEVPLNTFKKVKAIYPQISGDGIVTIDVGGRNLPNDTTLYEQTCHYYVEKDYKADYRINARYFSIAFSELADTQWQFTDFDIEFEIGGRK